ncbi:hypothetical protein [Neisseria sp.]|nr:hypothetical protein [Neisseria sp.]MDO4228093.1 hypothetical protein [Neisseria sp.]
MACNLPNGAYTDDTAIFVPSETFQTARLMLHFLERFTLRLKQVQA